MSVGHSVRFENFKFGHVDGKMFWNCKMFLYHGRHVYILCLSDVIQDPQHRAVLPLLHLAAEHQTALQRAAVLLLVKTRYINIRELLDIVNKYTTFM